MDDMIGRTHLLGLPRENARILCMAFLGLDEKSGHRISTSAVPAGIRHARP